MARFNVVVDTYAADLGQGTTQMADHTAFVWDARIRAFGEGYQVAIYFGEKPRGHGAHFYDVATKTVSMFFDTDRFPWVLDLLRNEGPIYVFLNSENPYEVLLTTGNEPVGEGEGQS